jgi:hypothetical protein
MVIPKRTLAALGPIKKKNERSLKINKVYLFRCNTFVQLLEYNISVINLLLRNG